MYRAPSRRKGKNKVKNPNLIPILDSVFIFIFFLLMTANFLKIFEINSDVPMVSPNQKEDKNPLALTLKIYSDKIVVLTGVPSRAIRQISNLNGEYDLENLRTLLISIKQRHLDKNTIILEPLVDVSYEKLVGIMDSVRQLRNTDPALWTKDENGLDKKINFLFSDIVFGNIQS